MQIEAAQQFAQALLPEGWAIRLLAIDQTQMLSLGIHPDRSLASSGYWVSAIPQGEAGNDYGLLAWVCRMIRQLYERGIFDAQG